MTNGYSSKMKELGFPEPSLVSVNGIQLEVFEAGRENKDKPIVLCHGWPEHAFSWRFQIPALVNAGYHVIVPNQRGYGNSSQPEEISKYDINHLTGDLVGLLDHFGYDKATFVGHDWGANVVWSMALLHPSRVEKLVALALPYQARGEKPWIEWMEELFGSDNYFVHFNKQPGVADTVLEEHTPRFLGNLFRKNLPVSAPEPGMMMINLAKAETVLGEPLLSPAELAVFVSAFESSGFTSSINWYRNLDRNWHIQGEVDPIVKHEALMIYGEQDVIPKFALLSSFVPNVEEVSIDAGHWIQQEKPEETNQLILDWLERKK